MGFADEVQSLTNGGSNISRIVLALNSLPPKERKEIVAFIDAMPPGTQRSAVARAITQRAQKQGFTGVVNGDQVRAFADGARNGLEA